MQHDGRPGKNVCNKYLTMKNLSTFIYKTLLNHEP